MPENTDSSPVTQLANIPPEPFSQLTPGTQIKKGDIYCNHNDTPANNWSPVPNSKIGLEVPNTVLQSFARLLGPEGYQILTANETIQARDVIWHTKEPRWQTAVKDTNGSSPPPTVNSLASLYPAEITYLARPETGTPDHITMPIPSRHRSLGANESVRRGDRMVCAGMDAWEIVSDRIRGCDIQEPDSKNKFVRYCRPISPKSGNWYVDLREGQGSDVPCRISADSKGRDAIGSTSNPFASIEGARKIIEKAATKANTPPVGVIWEIRGTPLFAYDIPEPASLASRKENTKIPDLAPSPAHYAEHPAEPVGDHPRQRARSKKHREALDRLDMEKFYVLSPHDSIQEGDMCYGNVDDAGDVQAWQRAPYSHNANSPVGNTRLMVRRRTSTTRQDLLKALADEAITIAEQALAKARQLRRSLGEKN